jgi:phenylacetic acid degradation operon negative regulatory protein
VVPGGEQDQEFVRRLRWRGFAELSRGVYAAPNSDVTGIRQLSDELGITPPLVASARFQDITPLANMTPFQATSGLAEAGAAYAEFIDNYRWTTDLDASQLSDRDAFVLRTMIVHDLRRARLRDPELPRELLPPGWSGDGARQLASTVYRATEDGTWRFAESVTGLTVDRTQDLLTRRFAEHPTNPVPTR